jgi:hypothetical protein
MEILMLLASIFVALVVLSLLMNLINASHMGGRGARIGAIIVLGPVYVLIATVGLTSLVEYQSGSPTVEVLAVLPPVLQEGLVLGLMGFCSGSVAFVLMPYFVIVLILGGFFKMGSAKRRTVGTATDDYGRFWTFYRNEAPSQAEMDFLQRLGAMFRNLLSVTLWAFPFGVVWALVVEYGGFSPRTELGAIQATFFAAALVLYYLVSIGGAVSKTGNR